MKTSELLELLAQDHIDEKELPELLVAALTKMKKRIATAESCTGGLVSGAITSVSGASGVFDCGVCTYARTISSTSSSVCVRKRSPPTARCRIAPPLRWRAASDCLLARISASLLPVSRDRWAARSISPSDWSTSASAPSWVCIPKRCFSVRTTPTVSESVSSPLPQRCTSRSRSWRKLNNQNMTRPSDIRRSFLCLCILKNQNELCII